MLLVVRLKVRRDQLDAFRTFERHAARVMRAHAGRIERTVVLAAPPDSAIVEEIHLVRFPSAAAFDAYRADPELSSLQHLRDAAVIDTDVAIGEDGPDYG